LFWWFDGEISGISLEEEDDDEHETIDQQAMQFLEKSSQENKILNDSNSGHRGAKRSAELGKILRIASKVGKSWITLFHQMLTLWRAF
jgi:hypothetical protein